MLKGFSAVMKGNMFNLPSGFLGNLEKFAVNAIKTFGVGAYVTAQKVALENIADMVLAGDRSRYTALVNQHLQEGMPLSNAQAASAFESIVTQPLDRSIEGGLMAAAFSVYGTYKNNTGLRANQALEVTGETGNRSWINKTDFRPLDEATLREIGESQRLLPGAAEDAVQQQLANPAKGFLGKGGSLEPSTAGAAAALKINGLDLQGKSGYNIGQTQEDSSYANYLKIMDEMDAANRAGMTAKEFAESQGVTSTLSDAEAAAAKATNYRMSDGEGSVKKFSEMTYDEALQIAKDYANYSPIKIPDTADMKPRTMNKGYEQITYTWRENGYKYVVRWHSRTPNAPIDQGNTWVIKRIVPGSGGLLPKEYFKIGDTGTDADWVSGFIWYKAIRARLNGVATPDQIKILDIGHWKE